MAKNRVITVQGIPVTVSYEDIDDYLYTRVSTTMQIDGYFLDAQKTKMKALTEWFTRRSALNKWQEHA